MRFPIYRQVESMDCGPTCIRMVTDFYKKKYPLQTLKEYCNVTRLGISIQDVVEGCKKTGLTAIPLQLSIDRIKDAPLPAILYWRQNHFVVLYKIGKNGQFHIADPSYGRIRLDEESFIKEWADTTNGEGIAILVEPQDNFSEIKPPKEEKSFSAIKKLFINLIARNKVKFFTILLFSLIGIVTNWFIPILFQQMIDNGIGGKNVHFLIIILLAQLMFFAGNIISTSLTNILLTRINLNAGLEMLSSYITKLTKLPVAFFDTKLNTDLIQRMDDQSRIQDYMTTHLIGFFLNTLSIIAFSTILFYYNRIVFLFYFIFTFLALLWVKAFINRLKVLDYSRFIIQSENKSNVYDLINGMTEVKINSAQHTKLSSFQKIMLKFNGVSIKFLKLNYSISLGASFINRLKDILIIGCSAYFVITDQITIGALLSINYVLGALVSPIEQMTNFVRNTQETKLSYERLNEIQKKENEDDSTRISRFSFKKGFEFSKVSFKYPGSFSRFVLNDINISIPKGKITAIVGASGSGKTTLLKLLLSFYYPQEGDVYLDGIQFSKINADEWRKRCGVVMQDGYIFNGTIAENIAISDEKPDIAQLIESARIACIDQFINSLPMKYETKIGNSGVEVSGGQKQRILIARAVYRNPDFIFFDEATSSLDANNEMEIMNNLNTFYQGKTVLIIAHRLSTVKNADNIIVLDNGYMKEQGTHQELTKMKGLYFELIRNQLELGD